MLRMGVRGTFARCVPIEENDRGDAELQLLCDNIW